MRVHCENTDCKYLNASYLCTRNSVYIDEDGECIDFEHFNTLKEYKEPYYIAVKTASGNKGRALKFGKKLVIKGYTFFTNKNLKVLGEECPITEERTGVLCGSIRQVKEMFEKFRELESKVASCASFPLCEYDIDFQAYMTEEEKLTKFKCSRCGLMRFDPCKKLPQGWKKEAHDFLICTVCQQELKNMRGGSGNG